MEIERRCYGGVNAPVAEAFNLMLQSVLVADKSICWLLFLIGSVPNNGDVIYNLLEAEKRIPFSDLNNVASTDAECKDASETEDDSDDEDAAVSDDSDNDAEESSGEDDDDEADPESDSDANDDDDEDDDDEDEDDDDDDDDEEDDDEEDEDEEEGNQPPFKKKK